MKYALAATIVLATAPFVAAGAQTAFGDTQLSYSGGVVYDDDLVPGRGPNQPFLVGEREAGRTSGGTVRRRGDIPRSSPNLIGPDGRIRDVVGRNDSRFPGVRIQP